MYSKYKDKGLEILAFPCVDFHQEFGNNFEVQSFAKDEFGIRFPLLGLIHCNGEKDNVETHPLFNYLTEMLPDGPKGQGVEWNFAKFLVDAEGTPVKRFGYKENLEHVEIAIKEALELDRAEDAENAE